MSKLGGNEYTEKEKLYWLERLKQDLIIHQSLKI